MGMRLAGFFCLGSVGELRTSPPSNPAPPEIFENEMRKDQTDNKPQQVYLATENTDASDQSSSNEERTGGSTDEPKAIIIARIISEECGRRRRRKEAFEWIRKRESKGKCKREIYYRGAELSRKDLKDAVRNCKESEKEACQRTEENRTATQGNGKETEADKRKQERHERGKRDREHARIWNRISKATKEA